MVRAHSTRYLVAIIASFSLLTLHSDGAIVYAQPRQLDYDRHLDAPSHKDKVTLERLSDLIGDGGIGWDETVRGRGSNALNTFSSRGTNSMSANDHLQTIGRPPPSSYVPERYIMVPPEQNFLRELILHSAAPTETRGAHGTREDLALRSYTLPDNSDDQFELKLPAADSARASDWPYKGNSPLSVKPKRLYHQLPQEMQKGQTQFHYMREDGLTEPRVAVKRWWGGYHRPRGQMDRRASQSKHYDCLKSCINEGKLHPIQCHTLC